MLLRAQHEWGEAIAIGERLLRERPEFSATLAQYHCELAAQSLQRREAADAQRHLGAALKVEPLCVRALIMLAELHAQAAEYKAAADLLQRLAQQAPDFVPEVLAWPSAVRIMARSTWRDYLDQALERSTKPVVAIVLARARLVQRTEGAASAERFLLQRLQQQPSLSGVQELLRLRGPGEHAADPVPGLLEALSRTRPRYRCDSCGFAGNKLYWQCPSCQSWSTVKPLKGHELV
ncbi:hypothetical protein ULG90_01070 [Halopseudomonas pachastrellae]|nr:hypothetical protein ULG90_01070 [Halopseudomonas pachastrellae]